MRIIFIRRRFLFILLISTIISLSIILLLPYHCDSIYCHSNLFFLFNRRQLPAAYLHYQSLIANISDDQCRIPVLDPWHESIRRYISIPDTPIKCRQLQPNVTSLINGYLSINDQYAKQFDCKYRLFGHNTGIDDFTIAYGEWKSLSNNQSVIIDNSDFVEVECFDRIIGAKVYRYHWSHIVKQRHKSVITGKEFLPNDDRQLSVIMFGVDSMSRSNWLRQFPLTHALMQSMGFVDMISHVKVADNTFGNWIAMLVGKRSTTNGRFVNEVPDKWDMYFDDWNLTWFDYSRRGYATLFAEDRPDIASFNYFGKLCGFRNMPTDHYYRFIKTYHGTRSFAFYWINDLAHEALNNAGIADADFRQFFADLADKNYLNNTIVIALSDHGHRYSDIRETVIGRLESRLPYLSIYIPPWLRERNRSLMSNLIANSQSITTPFDIYETLVDIAHGQLTDTTHAHSHRAYSLFGAVPANRTCAEAHIPDEYCPCYSEMSIDVAEAKAPANTLIDHINELLNRMAPNKCSPMIIDTINYASISLPPKYIVQDPQVNNLVVNNGVQLNYRIAIRVRPPSSAVFEALVVMDLTNNQLTVTGDIERNNRYGNTSACVVDPVLRKLCHCI